MTANLPLQPLLDTLDAISIEVTSKTVLARSSGSNNEAVGTLISIGDLVADMAALVRTIESLHRQRLFAEREGRS